MNVSNLAGLNKAITSNIIYPLFLILSVVLIIFNFIFFNQLKELKKVDQEKIQSTLGIYKSNLSEKLSTLASSTIFIDYLRSGDTTRAKLNSEFMLQVQSMRAPELEGMEILDNAQEVIYQSGEKSDTKVTLSICYLDNMLNSSYGQCSYSWVLYLNQAELLSYIQSADHSIQSCKKCKPYNLFENSKLGSFDLAAPTNAPLYVTIKNRDLYLYIITNILVLVSLLLMAFWSWRRIRYLVNSNVSRPLESLTSSLKKNVDFDSSKVIEEIAFLSQRIWLSKQQILEYQDKMKQVELGVLAAQVAHDIRSPLQVLDLLSQDMKKRFPDNESRIFSDATKRIHDIAAGLLDKYRKDKGKKINTANAYPVWLLLLKLVEEKNVVRKANHREINITLEPAIDKTLSAKFDVAEFQRVLSNLINNSIEALQSAVIENKKIQLKLNSVNKMIAIEIADNGKGISPERVAQFNNGGVIESKDGHGLGLSHAYSTVRRWGGDIKFESVLDKGTVVTIYLPLVPSPLWLRLNLHIAANAVIYLVDNAAAVLSQLTDILVKQGIDSRKIQQYVDINLFRQDCSAAQPASVFVFMNQTFGNTEKSGIDVLLEKRLATHSVLITDDFLDEKLQQQAVEHGVQLLPKPLLSDIAIIIEAEAKQQVEFVVLDDLVSVTDYWELRASEQNIAIKTFNNSLDFMRFVQNCAKNVKIYLDNDLGEAITGLEISKKLSDMGFRYIYLMTSRDDLSEKEYPWLTAVVSKRVPFDE